MQNGVGVHKTWKTKVGAIIGTSRVPCAKTYSFPARNAIAPLKRRAAYADQGSGPDLIPSGNPRSVSDPVLTNATIRWGRAVHCTLPIFIAANLVRPRRAA